MGQTFHYKTTSSKVKLRVVCVFLCKNIRRSQLSHSTHGGYIAAGRWGVEQG